VEILSSFIKCGLQLTIRIKVLKYLSQHHVPSYIFSSLTDPTTALIFSHNNLHFELHVRFIGLTFGPILMYKEFNGNAHLSIHILSLFVSTWLLIILVTLTLGWFISILTLEGFQYHFH
jgi:hypothetical protein